MSWLMQYDIVPFLIVLTILVFIHELGHYLVAKYNGVRVLTFSIGFGPEIFGFNDKSGTRWKFALIPLGGYVQMYGDGDPSGATQSEIDEEEKDVAFRFKTLRQRAAIVAAGPIANFLLAILLMFALFQTSGQMYAPAVVNDVLEGSAAEKVGLLPGDRITAIDGRSMDSFKDIIQLVSLRPNQEMTLDIMRDGETFSTQITSDTDVRIDNFGVEHRVGMLGIASTEFAVRKLGFFESATASVKSTYRMTVDTFVGLKQLILGLRSVDELGGPIRIAQMSGAQADLGIAPLIMFMAMLSINLGILNFLPIPVLDGGHLMYYAIEALRGKPLSERVQNAAAVTGMGFVLLLMLVVSYHDVIRLI